MQFIQDYHLSCYFQDLLIMYYVFHLKHYISLDNTAESTLRGEKKSMLKENVRK